MTRNVPTITLLDCTLSTKNDKGVSKCALNVVLAYNREEMKEV